MEEDNGNTVMAVDFSGLQADDLLGGENSKAEMDELENDLNALLDRCGGSQIACGNFMKALNTINELIDGRRLELNSVNANFEDDEAVARQMQEEFEKEDAQRKKQAEEEAAMLQQQYACQLCLKNLAGTADGPMVLELYNCEHKICRECWARHASSKEAAAPSDYCCPLPQCGRSLAQADVKDLVSPAEYERYVDMGLGGVSNVVHCPAKCGWAVVVSSEPLTPSRTKAAQNEIGLDGRVVSGEAVEHKGRFRFRCRKCPDTEFCASCQTTPYHLGFTCQGWRAYESGRKCRFCGEAVGAGAPTLLQAKDSQSKAALQGVLGARFVHFDKKASAQVLHAKIKETDLLASLCAAPECKAKAAEACDRVMSCGAACLGLKGVRPCLGCLREECTQCSQFKAAPSDLCNICWVEELRAAPCLALDCGHIFHYACVKDKLRAKWVGARVTFKYLCCPLCDTFMAAPHIASIMEPELKLVEAVKAKAVQRLALEGGHKDARELQPGGRYHKREAEYAMHKFAYYMCSKCKAPYFGGHRSCEVAADVGENQAFDPAHMVCGGCSSVGNANCAKHGAEAIEHKCKFCCSVASWFCWGNTHFCDSCHRKQGTPEAMTKKARKDLPQCTPATCPLKVAHPPNGEEFVLGCQVCRSESFV